MRQRFSAATLRKLRNDIPIHRLIGDVLDIPCKVREGYFRFLCPLCSDFNTATNPKTNLARCFRCERNFNPIDIVMLEKRINFVEAVEYLSGIVTLGPKSNVQHHNRIGRHPPVKGRSNIRIPDVPCPSTLHF
jgi:DNA primase